MKNTTSLLEAVKALRAVPDAEFARLEQVLNLLDGPTTPSKGKGKGRGQRKPMSAAAREKIAAAQRARWAKTRKAAKKAAKPTS